MRKNYIGAPKINYMKKIFCSFALTLSALLFFETGSAQIKSTQLEVTGIINSETFYLNSATKIGGKTRTTYSITLPANTTRWYYSFTTSPNENANTTTALGLLPQLSKLVDPTGISGTLAERIITPGGSGLLDVYLMNYEGQTGFLAKDALGTWTYTKPSCYIEGTRENFKNGTVEITNPAFCKGTFYLGFRNPSSTVGTYITLQVAAIVSKEIVLDEWSSQNKSSIYNYIQGLIGINNDDSKIVCQCCSDKVTNILPSAFYGKSENERELLIKNYLDDCYTQTGKTALKDNSVKTKVIFEQVQAHTIAKEYDSCAAKSIQLLNMGLTGVSAYNEIGWCSMLSKDFKTALKYLAMGYAKYPNDLYIRGNLAHAYLLNGYFEDAKKIYLENKHEKLTKDMNWKEMVESDYKTFREMGIYVSQMDEIKKLLKIK